MTPFPICERCGWHRGDCTCGHHLDDAQRARLHGAVAARNSGRRAIGFELREEQCAKAVEWRLSQAPLPFGEAS